jgi:hypothetical protein
MRAWTTQKSLGRPYSQIVGLTGLEAYALDMAVIRWGTAFDAALQDAVADAKNKNQAASKAQTVVRRWVPSSRQYR